jgi:hypothetical protein
MRAVRRPAWTLILVSGAGLFATAFLPSWDVHTMDDSRPIAVVAFLEGHLIGAVSAVAAVAWLAHVPWPRVVFWTQTVLTLLLSLLVGLLLHLLVYDCFEHHGREPAIGVTTAPAVGATLLWYGAFWLMVTSPAVDPRARSGRVAATGGAIALIWFSVFEIARGPKLGNHLALIASLFLVIAAWNAAGE